MVGLGFHVLSGHYFGVLFCICRYCMYFILHKIIALQPGMYVAIWHGLYFFINIPFCVGGSKGKAGIQM